MQVMTSAELVHSGRIAGFNSSTTKAKSSRSLGNNNDNSSDDNKSDLSIGPSSFLLLQPLLREDEGVYRCRVDFKRASTRNFEVQLNVIGNAIFFFYSLSYH